MQHLQAINNHDYIEIEWCKDRKEKMHQYYREEFRFIDKQTNNQKELNEMMSHLEDQQDRDIRES